MHTSRGRLHISHRAARPPSSCTGAETAARGAGGRSSFNCHRENNLICFSPLMNQPQCLSNTAVCFSASSFSHWLMDRQMPVGRQTHDILDTRPIFFPLPRNEGIASLCTASNKPLAECLNYKCPCCHYQAFIFPLFFYFFTFFFLYYFHTFSCPRDVRENGLVSAWQLAEVNTPQCSLTFLSQVSIWGFVL